MTTKTISDWLKVFVIAFLLVSNFATYAQLVNIEKQRKTAKPGWQGSIDFGFNMVQNTKSIWQFSNDISIQYTHKKHILLILNEITLLRINSTEKNYDLINKNFQHIRYNYQIIDSGLVTYELFIQNQQNKIRYIKERFLTGSGLRLRLVNSKNLKFYVAPLLMYEYEQLSDSLKSFSRMMKGDFYISGNFKINDRVSLTHVTYYQPALYDLGSSVKFELFKDFRLYSETNINFTIIKKVLDYSLNIEFSYDSRPPQELRNYPLFYNFVNKLTIKF